MENASKALLIAGSILIVILLIAWGVRVFNSTAGTADAQEETMKATEVATFNSKFTAYVGQNKSTAQVKSLANVVIANNATNETHKVKFTIGSDSTNGSTDAAIITTNVSSLSGKHTINPVYDTKGLYIVEMQIQ